MVTFAACLSSTQSNATGDGTPYTIICDTELYDDYGVYDNTSGNIMTAYFNQGVYVFAGTITIDGLTPSHSSISLDLVTSARTYNLFNFEGTPPNSDLSINYSQNIQIQQYDSITLQLTVDGSTKTIDVIGNNTLVDTSISGVMIS